MFPGPAPGPLPPLPILHFFFVFPEKTMIKDNVGREEKKMSNITPVPPFILSLKKHLAWDAVDSAPVPAPEQRLGDVLNPHQHVTILQAPSTSLT